MRKQEKKKERLLFYLYGPDYARRHD